MNGCTSANNDTEITEKIIIGLRPITSDIAPKNNIAKANVRVAADNAKLATVSLTLNDCVKWGINGWTLYRIEKIVNPEMKSATIILIYAFEPLFT